MTVHTKTNRRQKTSDARRIDALAPSIAGVSDIRKPLPVLPDEVALLAEWWGELTELATNKELMSDRND